MKWSVRSIGMGAGSTTCERCGKPTSVLSCSWFNTEMICRDCQKTEHAHPQFAEAREAEEAAVRAGNYNFPGIGLPDDLKVVKEVTDAHN